ncbi:PhoH family protein [Xanthomonas phage JGB6]|nr:PhoH family protein [Xanthomonas phage JGB6]
MAKRSGGQQSHKGQPKGFKGKQQQRSYELAAIDAAAQMEYQPRRRKVVKPLVAKTEAQGHYIMAIESHQLTFGTGPAGTGKTYICTRMACEAFQNGDVEKIIVTRPAVEASDGGMGFLPGDIHEKFAPYFAHFPRRSG